MSDEAPAQAVPELAPPRLEPGDTAAIRAHLEQHGFAVVKALSSEEVAEAEDLLWAHLEGREAATRRMTQVRPLGWRRGEPTSWLEGHGDALMTSTTHCDSMWYVRSRPGVLRAFHAAFGTEADELVASYDRMSVNLPTSSGNPEALRVAATVSDAGTKFGVAQVPARPPPTTPPRPLPPPPAGTDHSACCRSPCTLTRRSRVSTRWRAPASAASSTAAMTVTSTTPSSA